MNIYITQPSNYELNKEWERYLNSDDPTRKTDWDLLNAALFIFSDFIKVLSNNRKNNKKEDISSIIKSAINFCRKKKQYDLVKMFDVVRILRNKLAHQGNLNIETKYEKIIYFVGKRVI